MSQDELEEKFEKFVKENNLGSIVQKLRSGITVDINEEARKLSMGIPLLKVKLIKLNELKLVCVIIGNKLIPIGTFINMLQAEISSNKLTIKELASKLDMSIKDLEGIIADLVQKNLI